MKPSHTVEEFLDQQRIPYEIFPHQPVASIEDAAKATEVSLSNLVRAVILESEAGMIMLVIPANHLVDFSELRNRFEADLELAPAEEITGLLSDCSTKTIPPLAGYYGLLAAVDSKIMEMDGIYFQAGTQDALLLISKENFRRLYANAEWGDFSLPNSLLTSKGAFAFILPEAEKNGHSVKDLLPAGDIKKRIEKVHQMPAMPEMGNKLLLLKNNPKSTADDLADIVALDPSLSAQVVRYARSAFFGYRGEVKSIKAAIVRVLGFDMVMNMAMGLALGKGFDIPAKGPLGLRAFWRHAIFSATLCQAICAITPKSVRPKPDLAYLAGLLHNFGFLLMGHILKPEFFLLNKTVEANPDVPATIIEKELLGVSHTQIGTWLMTSWDMPEEVIITMTEHHNECYQGKHDNYVHLVYLVDCLLKARNLGDAADSEVPMATLIALGLEKEKIDGMVKHILKETAELDTIAQQLVR